MESVVGLVKGNKRKKNIVRSLEKIGLEKIKDKIKNKRVIIKPNLVSDSNQLASTDVESVEAIVDFLNGGGVDNISVAEFSTHDTTKAYKNFGYSRLDIDLVDLERESKFKTFKLDKGSRQIKIAVSRYLLSDNFIISLAKPKTHNAVVATLSIKNLLMGSIKNKSDMHRGYKEINRYLSLLAEELWPDLSIIDGFIGMEGNGPTSGQEVKSRWAISSLDALAADWAALKCMSIDPSNIGYLHYLDQKNFGSYSRKGITIKGDKIKDCKKDYKLHDSIKEQLQWKDD